MNESPTKDGSALTRRRFVKVSAAGGLVTGMMKRRVSGAEPGGRLRLLDPIEGAILNSGVGRVVDGGLEVDVAGQAPPDANVLIQGLAASNDGGIFRGKATLGGRETEIVVSTTGPEPERSSIRVLWDQKARKRYRFVIDDNSFFLRDITQKKYPSLFDCFYLGMLRDLHRRFGARFTLNIYYTTADGWDLSQFPDKYSGEWADNAGWLRLAFHAYANDPSRPYEDAPVENLLADLDLIAGEIRRFAGPATYSPPTVVHWGMTRPEAWKPLYDRGSRLLSGYFRKMNGRWDVNYRVDDFRSEWLSRNDLLKDFPSGIVFSKVDMVVNSTPLDQIVPTLEPLIVDPRQGGIIDLLTHEQYFWPFYKNHLPDHALRMERAIEFVTRHGYEPVFLQDEAGTI